MNKFLNACKSKFAMATLAGFGSLSVFAEGSTPAIDTTVASTALSGMVDAVKAYITTCVPYIVSLLGVALVVTLVWVAWKWIRKGANKAG